MAKAKITKNGNVQVVMSPQQWEVLTSIFKHVRLGDRNDATRAFSDLVIDLDEFNNEEYFDDDSIAVETYITYTNRKGVTKVRRDRTEADDFCIELDLPGDEEDEE